MLVVPIFPLKSPLFEKFGVMGDDKRRRWLRFLRKEFGGLWDLEVLLVSNGDDGDLAEFDRDRFLDACAEVVSSLASEFLAARRFNFRFIIFEYYMCFGYCVSPTVSRCL